MCTTDGGAACLWVLLQVSPLRGVHGVLSWHDAALTTWICLLLLLLSLLLPLLPWYWIARAVGLAALGPHMYLLGAPAAAPKPSAAAPKLSPALRRLDAAERYARATDKEGRQAIVEEERCAIGMLRAPPAFMRQVWPLVSWMHIMCMHM